MDGCVNHPDRSATHTCHQCGTKICFDCMEIYRGRHCCAPCEAVSRQAEAEKQPPVVVTPPRYTTGTVAAIIYGMGTAFVTSFLWEKMYFLMGVQFGGINILMGFLVGLAVLMGTRKSGTIPGLIGAVCSLSMAVIGHFLLMLDVMKRYAEPGTPLTPSLFFRALGTLDIAHWCFVALGVITGTLVSWKLGPPESEPIS